MGFIQSAARGTEYAGSLKLVCEAVRDMRRRSETTNRATDSRSNRHAGFLVTAGNLETAIAEQRIAVHYQPKIFCATGAIHSFEALARWQHPDLGSIPPAQFIAFAEREGLIGRITDIVLANALEWISSIQKDGWPKLCFNVSTAEIEDVGFVDGLTQRCSAAGVSAESVVVEVTESRAFTHPLAALEFMTQLRIKGFQVAIDDVGAGYASHARLAYLPFSYMKLDQSFVKDVTTSAKARYVVEHLIELGHKLDVQVVVEGVEDQEAMDIVAGLDCDVVQGFHIARPMEPQQAAAWFAANVRH